MKRVTTTIDEDPIARTVRREFKLRLRSRSKSNSRSHSREAGAKGSRLPSPPQRDFPGEAGAATYVNTERDSQHPLINVDVYTSSQKAGNERYFQQSWENTLSNRSNARGEDVPPS